MSGCYVETFREDATGLWGWQCFTCPDEQTGVKFASAAEELAEHHRVEVATKQLIDDGDLP